MTQEIEGTVESVLARQSAHGDIFKVVRVDGEGYFDWDGKVAKTGVKEGDEVKLRVSDGDFPRIRSIHRNGVAKPNGQNQPVHKPNGKDDQIVRMSCLRTAAQVLGDLDEPLEARREKVLAMADEMAKWVNNGSNAEA